MERSILIDEKEVKLKATASTIIRYRNKFHSDLIADMNTIDKAMKKSKHDIPSGVLEIFLNLSYTLAKQADSTIADDPLEWLDTFEIFPIEEVMPQVVALWADSQKLSVEAKNSQSRRTARSRRH